VNARRCAGALASLGVAAALLVTPAQATPARPAPTFTASSAPLPAALATGSWKESDPGRRARLAFALTNGASLTKTTYSAHWQSTPFRIPDEITTVLTAVPSGYYAHATDGADTYRLEVRFRMGKLAWSPWYGINGTIAKAPAAGVVTGYAFLMVARPPAVKAGTTMIVELRLTGSVPGDVSVIDSALDVRAGLDAGAPV
jgi:hypothetical protein